MYQPKKAINQSAEDAGSFPNLLGKPVGRPSLDPLKDEKIKSDIHKQTLKLLNGIRVASPIVKAVAERSGAEQKMNSEEIMRMMLKLSAEGANRLCLEMGIDTADKGSLWIKNSIERSINEFLRDQWVKTGVIDLNVFWIFTETLKQVDVHSEEWRSERLTMDVKNTVRISIMKAGIMIQKAQLNFDFCRNKEEDLDRIMNFLIHKVGQETQKMVVEGAKDQDRASVFSVLLSDASDLFVSLWNKEAKKSIQLLKSYSIEEQKKFKEREKQLEIDTIFIAFEKNFDLISMLALKFIKKG